MISIEPQTSIVLCQVAWENDYKNQRTFTDATAQASYFNGLTNKKQYSNFTYQRKDGYIDIGVNIEEIRNYNYVYYTNTGFTNKIFYAFITNMIYIGENITRIEIETDVFQTWQFDLIYNKCFVEREHVTDDTIGKHTYPENVETGEYICNSIKNIGMDWTVTKSLVCVATTWVQSDMNDDIVHIPTGNGRIYNGIYSGCYYVLFNSGEDLGSFLYALDMQSKADAIVSIFMVPEAICDVDNLTWKTSTYTNTTTQDVYTWTYLLVPQKLIGTSVTITPGVADTVPINTTLNGYTPKNNKLKCYPYNYLMLTNNCGTSITYNYEDFVNNLPEFETIGSVTTGCSITTYPVKYKKYTETSYGNGLTNYNYGISWGKFPVCAWASDTYTNWLTQNSLNIGATAIGGALSLGIGGLLASTGVATVAGIGMIGGGITAIASAIISGEQHSMIPPEDKGQITNGDACFSSNNLNVVAKQMSIRSEYAEIIDNYFEIFGYKVNLLKTPNITGRPYWNYVKTIDCNVEGNIPNDDLLLIRQMFDKGVTLWHTDDMYDYSKNNH